MTTAKKQIIAYIAIALTFLLIVGMIALMAISNQTQKENAEKEKAVSAPNTEKITTFFLTGTSPMYKKEILTSDLKEGASLKRMAYGEETDDIDIVPGVHGSANLRIDLGKKDEGKSYSETDAIVNLDVSILSKSKKNIDLPLIIGIDFDEDSYCDAFYSEVLTRGDYKINDPAGLEIEENVKDATVKIKGNLDDLRNDTKMYYFAGKNSFYTINEEGKGNENIPVNKDSNIEGMAVYNIKWFYPYKILKTADGKQYENNKDKTDPNDVLIRITAEAEKA